MLLQRHKDILKFMQGYSSVTANDVMRYLSLDQATVLNSLHCLKRKSMVKMVLKKKDRVKGTWIHPPQRYALTNNARKNFEVLMTKY